MFKHVNEILVQSLIVIECYSSGASASDTSYVFNVPEDMNHFNKWLFISVLIEHLWSRYIILNGEKKKLNYAADAYTTKKFYLY